MRFLNLVFILIFFGCSKKGGVPVRTNISLHASSIIDQSLFNGGVFFYGKHESQNEIKKIIQNQADETITLAQGQWDFFVFGWSGDFPLEGTLKCSVLNNKIITPETKQLDFVLTSENCETPTSFIGPPTLLNIHNCDDISTISSANANCPGELSELKSVSINLQGDTKSLKSSCINLSSSEITTTLINLPKLIYNLISLEIESFLSTDCLDLYSSFNIKQSIVNDINFFNFKNYTKIYLAGPSLEQTSATLPSSDSWQWDHVTTNDFRAFHSSVFTGSKLLVFGGKDENGNSINTGFSFDPVTGQTQGLSTLNAPSPRFSHTAVWSGNRMIVWGGHSGSTYLNDGKIYNPNTDTWSNISLTNAPTLRKDHSALWNPSGNEMIIWGGIVGGTYKNTGARYHLPSNTWTTLPTLNAPGPRLSHASGIVNNHMLIWGGANNTGVLGDGKRLNLISYTWENLSTLNAPIPRRDMAFATTTEEFIIWGGYNNFETIPRLNSGSRYNPSSDTWLTMSTANTPEGRNYSHAIWTGEEFFIWGGLNTMGLKANDGGFYNPLTDSWSPWSSANSSGAPSGRYVFSMHWDDNQNQIIIYGGKNSSTLDSIGLLAP